MLVVINETMDLGDVVQASVEDLDSGLEFSALLRKRISSFEVIWTSKVIHPQVGKALQNRLADIYWG